MVVIGFWLWFITMIAMLFIPVYDLIKGRIMTPRELLFFIMSLGWKRVLCFMQNIYIINRPLINER